MNKGIFVASDYVGQRVRHAGVDPQRGEQFRGFRIFPPLPPDAMVRGTAAETPQDDMWNVYDDDGFGNGDFRFAAVTLAGAMAWVADQLAGISWKELR